MNEVQTPLKLNLMPKYEELTSSGLSQESLLIEPNFENINLKSLYTQNRDGIIFMKKGDFEKSHMVLNKIDLQLQELKVDSHGIGTKEFF